MDCYDTTACPGDCEGCEYYDEMVARERVKRQRAVALAALLCFAACGVILFVVAHFGGGR